jgi:hypothetical protein
VNCESSGDKRLVSRKYRGRRDRVAAFKAY